MLLAAAVLLLAPQPADALQLARIRSRGAEQIHAASNYVCLETVERWVRKKPQGKFQLLDVIRMEVTVSGGKEIYSWPGGDTFADYEANRFTASGMLASGDFDLNLRQVFLNPQVALRHDPASQTPGTIALAYTVPVFANAVHVTNANGSATVGSHGVLRVDANTLDVVELEAVADEIPVNLGIDKVSSRVIYSSIRLTGADAPPLILPSAAESVLRRFTGEEHRNVITFSHWRQFGAESQIRFEGAGEASASAPPPPPARRPPLPMGLTLSARLRQPLDSRRAAVGDLIEADVDTPVVSGGKTLVPRGAVLSGRIRRMDRGVTRVPYIAIALELSAVLIDGAAVPVYATLKNVELRKGMHRTPPGSRRRTTTTELMGQGRLENFEVEEYYDNSVLSVASVYVEGQDVVVPAGLRFTWTTDSPRSTPALKPAAGSAPELLPNWTPRPR